MKKYLFIIMMAIILTGCTNTNEEEVNKVLTDEKVKTILINHVSSIESIDKTISLYKKDKVLNSDYTIEDYINMSLNFAVKTHLDTYTNNEGESYINSIEIHDLVKELIGPKTVDKVSKIDGCPSYTYDAKNDRYLISTKCNNNEKLISYVSDITYKGNEYYVNIYVGYVTDNEIYSDVNKTKMISKLDSEESYTIDKENMNNFTQYRYLFVRNSDGNYIFDNVIKVK